VPGAVRGEAVRSAPPLPGYLAVAAFAVLCATAVLLWRLPPWVPAVYLALSAVTAVVYAVDKRAARARTHRVSENTLHVLALAGGWPGAVVAQQGLRHKTGRRKRAGVRRAGDTGRCSGGRLEASCRSPGKAQGLRGFPCFRLP
jgi:uncharacterized membrane protein YsdA (DUF1294 family)